jgi:hypothetical protein
VYAPRRIDGLARIGEKGADNALIPSVGGTRHHSDYFVLFVHMFRPFKLIIT